MTQPSRPALSLSALFAEREARRTRDREVEAQLEQRKEEELSAWKQRLDTFELTDMHRQRTFDRIKAAFERGETEWMFASFPSSFCTDGGRAIANADTPPINPLTEEEEKKIAEEGPLWLATLPGGIKPVFAFWKRELQPGGFGLVARIINFPGGKPGDVGLFFTWSRDN